ncbi:MAG: M23 family metallopeptidase [Clostridiales bacterium]|nr:M23 family metallopeptidase [Clostridiales bacterium]
MRKFAFILFLLILLCAMVFVGFYYVTQRGILAQEVSLYNIGENTPVISEVLKINESNLLLDTLKSTNMIETIPPRYHQKLTLLVQYKLDITKTYLIYINPYTSEGCIEKGLLKKTYYTIPKETMDYILPSNNVLLQEEGENTTPYLVDAALYSELKNSLEYLGGEPEFSDKTIAYNLSVGSDSNIPVEYVLIVDMENQKTYANIFNGYYSISEEVSKSLFSLENIYNNYKEIMQPYPNILLSPGTVKTPINITRYWARVNPAGEVLAEETTEANGVESESLVPGQRITADYNPEQKPDGIILYEARNGEAFMEYDLLNEDVFVPEFEGTLDYILKAIYEHNTYPDSYGTISLNYSFTIDLPTVSTMLYKEARPGDILAFSINFADSGESFSLESNLGNFNSDFRPYNNSLIMYMPINWWTAPKDYSATIYKNSGETKEVFAEYTITVLPDDFVTVYQQLVVSDELAKKADPVNTANDSVMVREAKSNSNETSYLDGLFIMPLTGDLGTSYAQTRYINGKNPYRHSGLDIDGNTGDPIVAANGGKIVFSGELVRTGNTIIIDHGMELFSSYLHMSELDVNVGDFVEKGDLIGKVGSTGFSTGPHLHWSITLYGNYMSPLWLVENAIVPD